MKLLKSQAGFSPLHVLLLLVLFGIIGFAGWKVYETNKLAKSTTSSTPSPIIIKEESKIPEGFVEYENKEYGFKFAYPAEYGNLAKRNVYEGGLRVDEDPGAKSYTSSDEPKADYALGIIGVIGVTTFKSASTEILSWRYGPKIKLVNDQWIVTDPSASDQKVGNVFKDLQGNEVAGVKQGKLTIFIFFDGDEGCTSKSIYFVASNLLHRIHLPTFCDGTYGNSEDTKPNDDAKYTELVKVVSASIKATN